MSKHRERQRKREAAEEEHGERAKWQLEHRTWLEGETEPRASKQNCERGKLETLTKKEIGRKKRRRLWHRKLR